LAPKAAKPMVLNSLSSQVQISASIAITKGFSPEAKTQNNYFLITFYTFFPALILGWKHKYFLVSS